MESKKELPKCKRDLISNDLIDEALSFAKRSDNGKFVYKRTTELPEIKWAKLEK